MNSEMFWQVSEWLMFLAGCVALCVILTWPAVKGKWCLVVSLFLIILPEALVYLLPYLINHSAFDEAGRIMMGPEEYQTLLMYSLILGYLSLFGKLLFVVGVFRLRSQLRMFIARFSMDHDGG